MCLAIPMRITQVDGPVGVAELDGVSRRVRLDLLPEVALGDYVLVHAGLAIAVVDEAEANETLGVLRRFGNAVQ